MGVSLPSITGRSWSEFKGLTSELGPGGMSVDRRQFVVTKPGEYNFKINNSRTTVQILNQRNEVVATAKSQDDIASAQAKLGPGVYTAVVSQQFRGVNMREYSLEVTERQNPLITAGGGVLRGVAREAVGKDSGVQRHGLNVVQGGEFTANFSMPYSRWAIMDKAGKVVAAGDTMNPGKESNDFLKKSTIKLEPGQYEVVTVLPRKVVGEVPWNMTLVPKTASVDAEQTEERPIDKILRERESRLQQWAAEDARKPTGSGTSVTA